MFDAGPRRAGASWPPGHQVAHFSIVQTIGHGGMGVVYLANDGVANRQVALKVLHSDIASNPEKRKRFVREGKFLNALTHEGIAQVYEVGEFDDRVFIAMEYVKGVTLKDLIDKGPVDVERALQIACDVTEALGEAHQLGIVHRDLKPDNVMICNGPKTKLLDFGIAKSSEETPITDTTSADLTKKGQLLGTPAYMSPEQAKGLPVKKSSDAFSMGILIYEMLTGRRPFAGETWQELIIAVNRDDPPPLTSINPTIPPELERIVLRCLEKDPDKRYPSSMELAEDLRGYRKRRQAVDASRTKPAAADAGPGPATRRAQLGLFQRYPWLVAALVVMALTVVTIVAMVVLVLTGS